MIDKSSLNRNIQEKFMIKFAFLYAFAKAYPYSKIFT